MMRDCVRSLRTRLPTAVAVLLLAFVSSASIATTIAYDGATNRPTLFEGVGLDLGGGIQHYDVTVTWDSTFGGIFGYDALNHPNDSRLIAWGDVNEANAAIGVLATALIDDGYGVATETSYLDVPYFLASTVTSGRGVNLLDGASSSVFLVLASRSVSYGTVGFTQWAVSSVPEPATTGLLALGLTGLAATRRH